MNKLPACIAALFAAYAALQSAHAQYQDETSEQDAIVVTATRTAETVDQSLASVTVITREDIENSNALSVPELIRGVAGLDITVQGGFGKLSSFFLRGTNSTQVLALVDGLKWGSATSGSTSWEFLPLSEIERIEIVRGPRSSLYGSEAIGGVIQIFTRTGKGPPTARVEVAVGTEDTRSTAAGVSGGDKRNWYNVSASRFKTKGIDARQPTLQFGFLPLDEPDLDGYENNAFSARYGHRFANAGQIELFATQSEGNTQFDSSSGNEDDFKIGAVGAKYSYQPKPRWNLILEGGSTRDDRTTFRADGSVPESRFNTEIQTFTWQNDLTFGSSNLVTLGADYRNEKVDSSTDFKQTSRDNTGVFGQFQGKFARNDLLLGLRRDDNEQFGGETTGNIGWGYTMPNQMRVVASYGTGFRAPTFNDLFFPDFFGFPTSNPNLRPERSKSTETGVRGKLPGGRWDVRVYRTEIDNLIVLDQNFIPQNLNSATIEGVEAEISAAFAGWIGRAALSYVDPRDDASGNVLPRRSKKWLSFDLSRSFRGKTRLLFALIAQGPRFDDADNTIKVPGYGVVNVAARHQFTKNWELGGRINNLFDKQYQTVDTFNELGRNVLFTVAYRPKLPGRRQSKHE
ncbi:MAG: TonB-dependent vitamin B12 receptor [Gammaproteobacteria bacterium]|nr:MAG: TonB-dependent vitamin B12 receptor [Gammaproteobacteria bacterium]